MYNNYQQNQGGQVGQQPQQEKPFVNAKNPKVEQTANGFDKVTMYLDQEGVQKLLGQLNTHVNNPNGAVVTVTHGKTGKMQYPAGSIWFRAKQPPRQGGYQAAPQQNRYQNQQGYGQAPAPQQVQQPQQAQPMAAGPQQVPPPAVNSLEEF